MVYDGPDDQSMLIGELLGTPNHQVVKSISSSGRTIFIDFKKEEDYVQGEYDVGTVEFVASIKYNKINLDCQSWLENDILMSPNNPNINCSWLITRQFGAYISLDFSFIEVNPMNIYHSKSTLI